MERPKAWWAVEDLIREGGDLSRSSLQTELFDWIVPTVAPTSFKDIEMRVGFFKVN